MVNIRERIVSCLGKPVKLNENMQIQIIPMNGSLQVA